jgi:threonine aldolase
VSLCVFRAPLSGGASFNSGILLSIDGKRGRITADLVKNAINDPEFYHAPLTLASTKIQLIKVAVLVMIFWNLQN